MQTLSTINQEKVLHNECKRLHLAVQGLWGQHSWSKCTWRPQGAIYLQLYHDRGGSILQTRRGKGGWRKACRFWNDARSDSCYWGPQNL